MAELSASPPGQESQPRDYQPYVAGTFRWRLGLRPLDLAEWIELDDRYDGDVSRKAQLMDVNASTVNAAMEGTGAEGAEVLEALCGHLATHWPARFERRGDEMIDLVRQTSFDVSQQHEHPLFMAGRLVQEDLALLVERDGDLVFGAGSVCFPNRWDLQSKIGLALSAVHAPVAQLNEQLEGPIDSFFTRLTSDKPFWRLGWGVLDTDDPYTPLDGTAAPTMELPDVGDSTVPDRLFLRVERETLRRFPSTSCVLFTIRTYIRPLRHLAGRPDDARRLAEALENLPDDVRDYKRTLELTEAAVQWLMSTA
ncbi:MAG: heme-dependent oxidative N-demethylase family protein, partial [Actinomycetota bacterium]